MATEKAKKLVLNKETLRLLTDAELPSVRGGLPRTTSQGDSGSLSCTGEDCEPRGFTDGCPPLSYSPAACSMGDSFCSVYC